MLPFGHLACTWTALAWLQSHGRAAEIDYRGAAAAALLPDLIDKPLTLTLMSSLGTSQGVSHTLMGQALLTAVTAQLKRTWLPYALISNSHLLADQMWKYPRTLLFPFSKRFDSWKFMGTPSAMLSAYAEIAARPEILAVEAMGLVLFGRLVRKHRLHSRKPLMTLLRTGKLDTQPRPRPRGRPADQELEAEACA